jgi:rubrerythrin
MEENTFQKINQLLDRLREIESALGEFYGRCTFFFPEDKDLWEELKSDEIRHTEQVEEIITMVTEKKEQFHLGEFDSVALKTFLEDIEDQRDSLEKGEINRDNALFIARDCEDTLVEKHFYRAVESDDLEFIHLTEKIEQEERKHLEKLSDYIKSISIN